MAYEICAKIYDHTTMHMFYSCVPGLSALVLSQRRFLCRQWGPLWGRELMPLSWQGLNRV